MRTALSWFAAAVIAALFWGLFDGVPRDAQSMRDRLAEVTDSFGETVQGWNIDGAVEDALDGPVSTHTEKPDRVPAYVEDGR